MTTPSSSAPTHDDAPPVVSPPRAAARRALRVALWVVGAFLALAGAAYWNVHRVANETIERHRAKLSEERTRLAANARSRPAILEPAVAGTAEDVLARFEASRAAVSEDYEALAAASDGLPDAPPPAEVDRLLEKHTTVLVQLGDLLRVPSAAHAPPLGRGARGFWGNGNAIRAIAWIDAALDRAVAHRDRAAALGHVALLATLGADAERFGSAAARLEGERTEGYAAGRLGDVLALGDVDLDGARALARTLDVLDASRPSLAAVCDVLRASLRAQYLEPGGAQDLRRPGWHEMWSDKVVRAQALDACDDVMDRIRAEVDRDPEDRRAARRVALERRTGERFAPNQIFRFFYPFTDATNSQAAWRVGRAALAVAIFTREKGSPPPSLDALVPTYLASVPLDPWDGKPLRYAPGPPARVWSVGLDGEDNGGQAKGDSVDDEAPDVVVTIPVAR